VNLTPPQSEDDQPNDDVMGDYVAAGWTIDDEGRWHEPGESGGRDRS
jgi:hypothetical protein